MAAKSSVLGLILSSSPKTNSVRARFKCLMTALTSMSFLPRTAHFSPPQVRTLWRWQMALSNLSLLGLFLELTGRGGSRAQRAGLVVFTLFIEGTMQN